MKRFFTISPRIKFEKPSQKKKSARRKTAVKEIVKIPDNIEKIKIPDFDFDDYSSENCSDSDDVASEFDIEDEMEKYNGNSRKELFEIYQKELRLYEKYMSRISCIIDKKMSMSC